MSQVSFVLRRAADLVAKGWTQRVLARRPSAAFLLGQSCMPEDPEASCWCLAGAIERAVSDLRWSYSLVGEARLAVSGAIGRPIPYGLAGWNDTTGRTATEVRALLLKAAERADTMKGEEVRS